MTDPILATFDVVKRFQSVVALRGVSFDLLPGEVHAISGENGAGKSTLIKVLSGIYPHGSYEGRVEIAGRPAEFTSPRDAEAAGIAVIYQELALVPALSVAENLCLGAMPRRFGLVDWDRVHLDARRLLDAWNIDIDVTAPVESLGVGKRQLLEIAKALGKRSKILILDEPTAALSDREVDVLLEIVRELKGRGIASVYISHRLDEVFALADRITVLRDGKTIVTLDARATTPSEVIRHMVGREIQDLYPRRESAPGPVLFSVRDLEVAPAPGEPVLLSGIGFDVRAGEVLGIGGLMGAGRTELLMHLFGAFGERRRGEVTLGGRPFQAARPSEALRRGLALVTEDRKRYGLFLDESIGYNLSLSSLAALTAHGLVDRNQEIARGKALFESLRIKAQGLETPASALSGGNQQKVVLGKALMTEPEVVLLDEPTRGIDVGAKIEVYELVNRLTAAGKAVVLVSSELPELLGMIDRILMLHEGRLSGTFSRSEATPERLLAAAMGRSPEPSTHARGLEPSEPRGSALSS
jgi:D-xylose transport system ATP-binding protein